MNSAGAIRIPKRPTTLIGRLSVGRVPRVVGTISTAGPSGSALSRFALQCDIAELRIDLMGTRSNWVETAAACEGLGLPTLLTVRQVAEGGRWQGSEAKRKAVFQKGLDHVSGVDLEAGSHLAAHFAGEVKAAGKAVVLSYHNFDRTPSALELGRVVWSAGEMASIVKITTMVSSIRDLRTFAQLLGEVWAVPVCVMGMGPLGRATRKQLPGLGSCLTYGYLDQAVAPGQPPAGELSGLFHRYDHVRCAQFGLWAHPRSGL